jgi:hypothetical protein
MPKIHADGRVTDASAETEPVQPVDEPVEVPEQAEPEQPEPEKPAKRTTRK